MGAIKITRSIFRKNTLVFLFGAFIYGSIEIMWRGFTHPSMLLLGGLCFSMIYHCEKRLRGLGMLIRSTIYAAVITFSELAAGIILNLVLKLAVWDYSDQPFNLFGQICLPFFLVWVALSAVGCIVCGIMRFSLSDDTG